MNTTKTKHTTNTKNTTNLTEEEYLERIIAEYEAEKAYETICSYGPCYDEAWQEGIQI